MSGASTSRHARTNGRSERDTEEAAGFTGRVLSGLSWNIVTIVVSECTRVVVAVILARLLLPADYGVAGMAFLFSGLVTLFSDLALGGALVQRRNIDEDDASTVFWASVAFSTVVMAFAIGVSGVIAAFFRQPEVRKLIIALSFSFPLAALSTTQVALLTRKLEYRSLQLRQIIGVLAGAVVAIALATAGFGPWAIVGNALTASALSTILLWQFSSWRPRMVFSFASLHALGGFGLRLFGVRLLNYANRNADNTLIGRFAGASALGTYSLAYNVVLTPVMRIESPIGNVVYPALARMQNDRERMLRAWLRSKRLSAFLLAPAYLMIVVTAPDLVHVLVGPKWNAAVPVVQLLALGGVGRSLVTLNWAVLQATGRVRTELRVGMLATALTVAAFAAGVHWGAVGVAASYAAVSWLLVLIWTWATTRAVSFSFRKALFAGGSAIPPSSVAAAAALGTRLGLTDMGTPGVLRLFAEGAVGAGVYALLVRIAAPSLVHEIRDVLRRRRDQANVPAAAVSERTEPSISEVQPDRPALV